MFIPWPTIFQALINNNRDTETHGIKWSWFMSKVGRKVEIVLRYIENTNVLGRLPIGWAKFLHHLVETSATIVLGMFREQIKVLLPPPPQDWYAPLAISFPIFTMGLPPLICTSPSWTLPRCICPLLKEILKYALHNMQPTILALVYTQEAYRL